MSLQEAISKAKVLTEALPYIRKFHGQYLVIKYGGSLMYDQKLKNSFASDVSLLKWLGINPIIIHGGGKEITSWLNKLGKETKFIEGLRYTDQETMEITEMILSGKISKDLVGTINQNGGKAVGLSGKDAKIYTAKKIKSSAGEDLGFVGDIDSTDMDLVIKLSESGYIPVIASVTSDNSGETLNLNADYVANGIASALKALKLIYLTDVDGVMINKELLQIIDKAEAEKLLKHPEVQGGMLPKLQCALKALQQGVRFVHIINGSVEHAVLLEIFTDLGIGTMLVESKK